MPVLIVDTLQAVHIEKHNAEGTLRAARTIEFRFHHAEQPAIVRQAGQGIAYGERANLIEKSRLVQHGAKQHHHVTGGFTDFSEKEWPVQKMAGKSRRDV